MAPFLVPYISTVCDHLRATILSPPQAPPRLVSHCEPFLLWCKGLWGLKCGAWPGRAPPRGLRLTRLTRLTSLDPHLVSHRDLFLLWCKGLWTLDWPGPAAGFNIQKYSMLVVGWARLSFWVGWVLAIVLGRWFRLGLTAGFVLGLWSGALGRIVECEGPFFLCVGPDFVFFGRMKLKGFLKKHLRRMMVRA